MQLNPTEYLLRLTMTMLSHKQHAGIGLDALKIIILMLKVKNALVYQKIGSITFWRPMSDARWTCRIIRSWSHSNFEMFENIRNDSKARILGATRVEAKRCRMASCHVWTVASIAAKERLLASYWQWKVDTLRVKDSLCINISMVQGFCSVILGFKWL